MEGGSSFWHPPKAATQAQIDDAQRFVNAVIASRPPAPPQFVRDRCAALLAHFFHAATGEKLNSIVAIDWMAMLAPFPLQVLQAACMRWLETSSARPKPAEIRDLCISFYGLTSWNNLERAGIVAKMAPSAPEPSSGAPEELKRPDEDKKAKVAEILHKNRLAHSPEFCAACKAEAKTE